MENDNDLTLAELDQTEVSADNKLQVRNRFQQLANAKAEAQSKAQEAEKAKVDAEAKVAQLTREAEFFKTFNQLSAKHPEAASYQDQVLERVNRGYDAEEALLGLLAKDGKIQSSQPQVRQVGAEGGSAITNISEGDKPLNEMSSAEKLAQLQEFEKSGDLAQALRAGINRS